MKYIIVLISLSILTISTSYGQRMDDFLFSGVVLNAGATENPISLTNIYLKNGVGTATDTNGFFAINVNNGDSLIFSHIGFRTQTIVISDLDSLNKKIYLTKDTINIAEVKVYPFQNYEEFKKSFINMPFEYNVEVFNAKNNIALCLYQARSGIPLAWTADDIVKHSLQHFSNNVIYAGQISPENMISSSQIIMGIFSSLSKKKHDADFLENLSNKQNQFYDLKAKQHH